MRIATDFEGARIEVLAAERGAPIRLAVPPDPAHPRFRQWFAFAVEDAAGESLSFALENAGSCTWPRAWADYRVCASHDGEAWFRVPTTYSDGVLRFEDTPGSARAYYAYYPPCSNARIDALVARAAAGGARTRSLVRTEGGRDVMLVEFGRASDVAPAIWIVAQQHPGEHMAGFWVEGFVGALLARGMDARALLSAATVAIVPRINPDGVAIGAHRTNAAGIDMNRQWLAPDAKAPEVAAVRAAMQACGCAFFLDVHGDEVIPYVFAQGTEGVPMRTPRAAALEADFLESLGAASPDLQTVHGYPNDAPGKANLRIASNWAADLFDALSFTLEMPFIDNANRPDARAGWSIERCRALGAAFVPALAATLPRLGGRRG
jgi:murein tripeptide amidase MpaA